MARATEWKRANPERAAVTQREAARRYAATPAGRAGAYERVARWRRAHPEEARKIDAEAKAHRRAREHAVEAEDVDRAVVWIRDAGICGICGKAADPLDWHLDHVVPLAKGGAHIYANVQVSHPPCNVRKGARMLDADNCGIVLRTRVNATRGVSDGSSSEAQ